MKIKINNTIIGFVYCAILSLGCANSGKNGNSANDHEFYLEYVDGLKILYAGTQAKLPYTGEFVCDYSKDRKAYFTIENGKPNGKSFLVDINTLDTVEKSFYNLGEYLERIKLNKKAGRYEILYKKQLEAAITAQDDSLIISYIEAFRNTNNSQRAMDYGNNVTAITSTQLILAFNSFEEIFGKYSSYKIMQKSKIYSNRNSFAVELITKFNFENGYTLLKLNFDEKNNIEGFGIIDMTKPINLDYMISEFCKFLNEKESAPIWITPEHLPMFEMSIERYSNELGLIFGPSNIEIEYKYLNNISLTLTIRGKNPDIRDRTELVNFIVYYTFNNPTDLQYLSYKVDYQRKPLDCYSYYMFQ